MQRTTNSTVFQWYMSICTAFMLAISANFYNEFVAFKKDVTIVIVEHKNLKENFDEEKKRNQQRNDDQDKRLNEHEKFFIKPASIKLKTNDDEENN